MEWSEEFVAAQAFHHQACRRLTAALERHVAAAVIDEFPNAVELRAWGEYGEDGELRLRAHTLVGAGGKVIVANGLCAWDGREFGEFGDDETRERFDAVTDDVDDYLDWIAGLHGDDYLRDASFPLVEILTESLAVAEERMAQTAGALGRRRGDVRC